MLDNSMVAYGELLIVQSVMFLGVFFLHFGLYLRDPHDKP
jgi:hypothetical protein